MDQAADDARRVGLAAPDRAATRVLLVTLGSRGDIQPFCVLGRELAARGYPVSLIANEDYRPLVRGFGLDLLPGTSFKDLFSSEEASGAFEQYAGPVSKLRGARSIIAPVQDRLAALMSECLVAIRSADLVIYNAMAFFVGEIAHELKKPAIRLACQPLLPSWREPLCLFGGRSLGRPLNRASYEVLRLVSATLLRRPFRTFRSGTGFGRRLRGACNPLTIAARDTHQLLAFSGALSPDPGDWPRPYRQTGFLLDTPRQGETLPAEVEAFLAAGPPPIYVGFGSMRTRAEATTRLVLDALALRGGRAILARGAGGIAAGNLPPNVLAVGAASHALLFPRVSAVVHHGGSGTTAAALRHGRPSVVLPVLGDQLFWGRRVAALGAAEPPVPLGRVTAPDLAARMRRVEDDGRFRQAAACAGAALARDPGVAGAADFVDEIAASRGSDVTLQNREADR